MSTEQNRTIAHRHMEEVWNQGDLGAADDIHAPDYTFHEQANPPIRGAEAYRQSVGTRWYGMRRSVRPGCISIRGQRQNMAA